LKTTVPRNLPDLFAQRNYPLPTACVSPTQGLVVRQTALASKSTLVARARMRRGESGRAHAVDSSLGCGGRKPAAGTAGHRAGRVARNEFRRPDYSANLAAQRLFGASGPAIQGKTLTQWLPDLLLKDPFERRRPQRRGSRQRGALLGGDCLRAAGSAAPPAICYRSRYDRIRSRADTTARARHGPLESDALCAGRRAVYSTHA